VPRALENPKVAFLARDNRGARPRVLLRETPELLRPMRDVIACFSSVRGLEGGRVDRGRRAMREFVANPSAEVLGTLRGRVILAKAARGRVLAEMCLKKSEA
jgi:hypothetical protein